METTRRKVANCSRLVPPRLETHDRQSSSASIAKCVNVGLLQYDCHLHSYTHALILYGLYDSHLVHSFFLDELTRSISTVMALPSHSLIQRIVYRECKWVFTLRSFYDRIISFRSAPYHDVLYGDPQGSVLGPLLFILYTTPLSTGISNSSANHQPLADPGVWKGGPYGECEARAYNGGFAPSGVQGQNPWFGGQRAKPPWSWT